jgi:hypothetical protein
MSTNKGSTARIVLFATMLLSVLMLGGALRGAAAARAGDDNDHRQPQANRYYDKKNHDYHEWNDNEDRAYHSYVNQNHQQYRAFETVKPRQQQQYFAWRHQHPDSTLFKLEIK